MIPKVKLYLYAAFVAAAAIGTWYYGHTRYNAGQDDIRAEVAEQVAAATAETARIEAAWAAQNKELDDAWKAKLAAAKSDVSGLSARLRRATGRCAMPGDPAAPSGASDGGVPEGIGEIERDSDAAWAAAAADSAKLIDVVTRYNNLRKP